MTVASRSDSHLDFTNNQQNETLAMIPSALPFQVTIVAVLAFGHL